MLVVLTLVLDVYLTYEGLQHGYAEGNPVMGTLIEEAGFVALGAAKAGVLGVAVLYRSLRPEYAIVIPLGVALPWLSAVAVNAYHLAPIA
jgi:hypothetical protein